MCNDYRNHVARFQVEEAFGALQLRLLYPEGIPNFEPRDDIRITDRAPILRAGPEPGTAELLHCRWSWPGPTGKPVYNFRSDGRTLDRGRCLIVADGFYEFTAHSDPKSKRKHKWLFTMDGEPWFCIAGLWQRDPQVGPAFTMLTTKPGPDIAAYHDRQIAVLRRDQWARWLDPSVPAQTLIGPLPAGALAVEQIA